MNDTIKTINEQVFHVPLTGSLDIVIVDGRFDAGLNALAGKNSSLWSAEELARWRGLLGTGHPISTLGSYVQEGFVYVPDRDADILIVNGKNNPIVRDPIAATRAHKEDTEVYLTHKDLGMLRERAETDPERARTSGVYRLQRKDVKDNIPTNRLQYHGPTQFLFGDEATSYGGLIQAINIQRMDFYVADADYVRDQKHEGQAFARALWVCGLGYGSGLLGSSVGLHDGDGCVGGVRSYVRIADAPQTPQETMVSELETKLGELMPGQIMEHNGRVYECLDPASLKR